MILTAFWAWAFFHNVVPLKLASKNETEDAFTAVPRSKNLHSFKSSRFYRSLVHFQSQFIPNASSPSISLLITHPVRSHLVGVETKTFNGIPRGNVLYSASSLFPDVYIPSPALYLLSRVDILSPLSLLYLCNLMMGRMKRFPEQQKHPEALLTKNDLLTFTEQNDFRGTAILRKILPYTLEHMESPAEAQLATLLFSPKQFGGCELPLAEANASQNLTPEQSVLVDGKKAIRPDFYWPKYNFGLEYDSSQYHSSAAANDRDRRRSLAAGLSDMPLFSVTPTLLHNPAMRSSFLQQLARRLGTKLSNKEGWLRAQEVLWAEIRAKDWLC